MIEKTSPAIAYCIGVLVQLKQERRKMNEIVKKRPKIHIYTVLAVFSGHDV